VVAIHESEYQISFIHQNGIPFIFHDSINTFHRSCKNKSKMFALSSILFIACILFVTTSANEEVDLTKDHHESCGYWTSMGGEYHYYIIAKRCEEYPIMCLNIECEKNPNYMLNYCAPSCTKTVENILESFYDLVENDIHGNKIDFSRFRGKVIYMINVASYCGYTQDNYAQFRTLQKYYPEGLEIVLAPCNAFGAQEPGTPTDIHHFAEKQGFGGIILSKTEVNGPNTGASFKFLKAKAGKSYIQW